MSLKTFLQDKLTYITISGAVILAVGYLLYLFRLNVYALILVLLLFGGACISNLGVEYLRKEGYYRALQESTENLDKKYLLSEVIEKPRFLEGKLLYHYLKVTNKAMNDEISKYRLASAEYREYVESWVHEIKTPIASSKLIIGNNPTPITLSLEQEIDKINGLVEQTLYYARSNNVEKDYIIKEVALKDLVMSVIKENAKIFIVKKVALEIDNIDFTVYTDIKWLKFVLNQIITNALKYIAAEPQIRVFGELNEHSVALYVQDNGIGIAANDVSKVFEKGFTGGIGREYAASTGLGLYLCKKLCDKMGVGLSLQSELGKGTTVKIVFPLNRAFE